MKKIFIIMLAAVSFLFLINIIKISAQENQYGMPLVVTAKSGLNLREQPSGDGKILAIIPENSTVYLNHAAFCKKAVVGKITGCWITVNWKETGGYVFSGFLKKKTDKVYIFEADYTILSAGKFAVGEQAKISIDQSFSESVSLKDGVLSYTAQYPPCTELTVKIKGIKQSMKKEEIMSSELLVKVSDVEFIRPGCRDGGGLDVASISADLISVKKK